jgi:uncharacterized RDD family membrane protein YckC
MGAAGLADAVENYFLWQMLISGPSDTAAMAARWAAMLKFALILLAILYIVFVLISNLFHKKSEVMAMILINNDGDTNGTDSATTARDNAISEIKGAGFWIRALARGIDIILYYVVVFLTSLFVGIFLAILAILTGNSLDQWLAKLGKTTIISFIIMLLAQLVYHIVLEGLHGATLGKLIFGLVTISEDGSPCGLKQALKRSLAILVDSLFFGIPAAVSMSKSPKQQRIGDKWARTMVVKRRDIDGMVELNSGLRFIIAFLLAITLEGMLVGLALLLKLL